MKVYFLSYRRAALRLNGLYLGIIDGFERRVEIAPTDSIFAEIIPENNALPINFILDKNFIANPPPFCNLYVSSEGIFIHIKKFAPKNSALKVILQTRQLGCLYTIFSQGDIILSCEGTQTTLTPLPDSFSFCEWRLHQIGGLPVIAFYGGESVCLASPEGKILFLNKAKNCAFGKSFTFNTTFESCASITAECEFAYDGEKLRQIKCVTKETRPVDSNIIHFALFESLLARADYKKYLGDELKERADMLINYLGEYTGVTVPPESFYYDHGDIAAAGLVYRQRENLFKIKYFAADIQDGKITNIYPVE